MDTTLLFLLGIHVLACVLCALLTGLRVLKSTFTDVFVMLVIPVFGFFCLVMHAWSNRNSQRKTKELALEKLKLSDEARKGISHMDKEEYQAVVPLSDALVMDNRTARHQLMRDMLYDLTTTVDMEEDRVQEKVVPLQEALLLNDSQTRRELIMDVLYTGPGGYVSQLSQAKENDDTEVVHYAVTALVEIQKEFDLQFQEMERKLAEAPEDRLLLREYQRLLERWLSSGLAEGSRLEAQLREYVKLLENRLKENSESLTLWIKKADADMRLGDREALEADARRMIAIRPENEQGYLYLIKYYAMCGNYDGIRDTISELERSGVYLSVRGREETDFWRRKNA